MTHNKNEITLHAKAIAEYNEKLVLVFLSQTDTNHPDNDHIEFDFPAPLEKLLEDQTWAVDITPDPPPIDALDCKVFLPCANAKTRHLAEKLTSIFNQDPEAEYCLSKDGQTILYQPIDPVLKRAKISRDNAP